MTNYCDGRGRKIMILPCVAGFCARRQRRDKTWNYWNFGATFSVDEDGAQRRLDALAAKKGLVKEEAKTRPAGGVGESVACVGLSVPPESRSRGGPVSPSAGISKGPKNGG